MIRRCESCGKRLDGRLVENKNGTDAYIGAAQIEESLSISRAASYNVLRQLPVVRVGRSVRVKRSDFEAWLSRNSSPKARE